MPSQPLCLTLTQCTFDMTHNVPILWKEVNVCHHSLYMYDPICTTNDITSTLYDIAKLYSYIISTLYDHNPIYLCNQMHYIHYITRLIYDISSTLYDVTFTMCVTSHNDSMYDIKHYVYDIFTWNLLTHRVITTHPLCAFTAIMPDINSVYFWHDTQCTNFMKRSECMSSQPLYVWPHMHYIWHHIHSLWYHTTLFMT